MNRVFIVDTENTNDLRFLGEFHVNQFDSVYFLFNRNSKKLGWQATSDLYYTNCNVEFIELQPTGIPNGLDFQISSFLGTLLEKLNGVADGYYIVSKDKGFMANKALINELYKDVVFEVIDPETCKFMGKEKEEFVVNSIEPVFRITNIAESEKANVIRNYLKEFFTISEIEVCLSVFFLAKTLSSLHDNLVNAVGSGTGNELYKCVKGFFNKSAIEMLHYSKSNPIGKFTDRIPVFDPTGDGIFVIND